MPTEICYLIGTAVLFFVMILVQGLFANLDHGLVKLAGPRDGLTDKSPKAERARRANQNMIESLVMFVPLIFAGAYLEAFNGMTALGAALFFWARVAYAPLYWFGVPWLRTLAWAVALLGMILIFLQLI